MQFFSRVCMALTLLSGSAMAQSTPVPMSEPVSPPDNIENARSAFNGLGSNVVFEDSYLESISNLASLKIPVTDIIAGHSVVVVDRNPQRQALIVFYVHPDGSWEDLYTGHVSTGKPGRKEHFKTPTGVFILDGSIMDYRAEGTFNGNHIRGIGLKGSRVWDFGWQQTEDWRTPGAEMAIRMEMHATDPANLELRIGRPDSEGCIRIHADLNKVMDQFGVLDESPEALAAEGDSGWKQLLGKKHQYNTVSGKTLVIIDTSQKS